MKNRSVFIIIAVVLLNTAAGIATAATVTQNITYQGVMTDAAGNPLTGTYSITFRLYDAATGGTLLGTTGPITVTVTKGLFTTPITFDSSFFDGRALWLGIAVGIDPEMTPRQEIRPVPYASSLKPGAIIHGSDDALPVLTVKNTGITNSPGLRASTMGSASVGVDIETIGSNSHGVTALTSGIASYGVIARTFGLSSIGIDVSTTSSSSDGVHVSTSGPSSHGMYVSTEGENSHGVYASTTNASSHAVYASSMGNYSDGVHAMTGGTGSPAVYAESAQDVGVYGKGKTGGYFTTTPQAQISWRGNPGVNVSTIYNYNPGVLINTAGFSSHGVYAWTYGDSSDGVIAMTDGNYSQGVVVRTWGDRSEGVYAMTDGANSTGVFAITDGDYSQGVYARTWGDRSEGVIAMTDGANSTGVYARTQGASSNAVQGETSATGTSAIVGKTTGRSSAALYGYTTNFNSVGLHAQSAQSKAIWAQTDRADNKYGLQTPDIIRALNYETGSSDVAEYFPVTEDFAPGTVLVIGDDGRLGVTSTAYDTRVAGIVSTEPGVSLGTNEEGNPGEAQVAIAGRVPCKVDATKTPVHAGDLLTASDTPGHAMKATDPKIGTILGKALGTLESGTGTIEVLVMLQ